MVGRLLSYWEGNFSGAMLNFEDFEGVHLQYNLLVVSTHLKNMLVKLDHLPKSGWNKKCLKPLPTQIILSLTHINTFQPYMRSITLIKGKFIPWVKSQNINETWEKTSEHHHFLRFQLDKIWLDFKLKFRVSLCSCQTLILLAIVASKRCGN